MANRKRTHKFQAWDVDKACFVGRPHIDYRDAVEVADVAELVSRSPFIVMPVHVR